MRVRCKNRQYRNVSLSPRVSPTYWIVRVVLGAIFPLMLAACGGGAPTVTAPSATPVVIPIPATRTPGPAAPASSTGAAVTAVPATVNTPALPPAPTATPAPLRVDARTGLVSSPPTHIFLIVMENHEIGSIIGSPDAPYFSQLAAQHAMADQYYGLGHPSLANYLALISGHTDGIRDDENPSAPGHTLTEPTIAESLQAKGMTWKTYQEDMPTPCYMRDTAGTTYAIKHNPFLYFQSIRSDPAKCNQVVPLTQLDTDLQSGNVPNFSFITPNLIHDMHDGTVAGGDEWLAGFLPKLLESDAYKQNGLIFITFDEGTTNDGCCGYADGGRIPLIALAPNGQAGQHATAPASQYDLLRTIEDLWGLDRLGHTADPTVHPMWDLLSGPSSP
jgi:hypothetical protein